MHGWMQHAVQLHVVEKDVGMGLCQHLDFYFHASSLPVPCLHTFWYAIPTFLFSCKLYMVATRHTAGSYSSLIPTQAMLGEEVA